MSESEQRIIDWINARRSRGHRVDIISKFGDAELRLSDLLFFVDANESTK